MSGGEFVGSWRSALRIARRSAWRNKGRSALILMLLALPAYAGTVLAASWANLGGSARQQVDYQLGRADVMIGGTDLTAVAAGLPPGSRAVRLASGRTVVRTPDGLAAHEYEAVDAADPLMRGRYRMVAGVAPRRVADVAVTSAMADVLGVRPGDRLTAGLPQRELTVVGVIDVSRSLRMPALLVAADAPLSAVPHRHLLVDLPEESAGWEPPAAEIVDGRPVHEHGRSVMHRKWMGPSRADMVLQATGALLVTGFAGAQIVALAGAAFAIGVRRQRRELAMVAAVGATARQVGRIVLAGGLVLGVLAAVGGTALGLLTFRAAEPTIERVADHPLVDASIPSVQIGVVAVLAVLTGLLAALVPARTAGRSPLRAARGGQRARSRVDVAWLAGGVVLATVGALAVATSAHPNGRAELIAAGAIAGLAGIMACAPALIRAAGYFAAVLPLSGRLALRQAARQRLRTAAAVAAVTAAVAGTVALTLVGAARGAEDAIPSRVARSGQVLLPAEAVSLLGPDAVRRVAQELPVRETVSLHIVTGSAHGAVFVERSFRPDAAVDALEQDRVAVGGAEVIRVVTGRAATAVELDVLAAGGAVLFNDMLQVENQLTLGTEQGGGRITLPTTVAARGAYFTRLPGALISAATAARHGLRAEVATTVLDTTRRPGVHELAAAKSVLLEAQIRAGADGMSEPIPLTVAGVRKGGTETNTMFYVLASVSAAVTIAASFIAVGLAASELRGDLSTMAAVGATPRVRRRIAAAQAGVIGGLGALLGLAAGVAPAAGYVAYNVEVKWHVPWGPLLIIAVVAPVSTAVLAGSLTRTRLRLARRVA